MMGCIAYSQTLCVCSFSNRLIKVNFGKTLTNWLKTISMDNFILFLKFWLEFGKNKIRKGVYFWIIFSSLLHRKLINDDEFFQDATGAQHILNEFVLLR